MIYPFDGWHVELTNKESTDPVTTELCTSINGKPITDMSGMFSGSQATSLDLSSFDTSKVTEIRNMFYNAANLKTIYASDKFVTTNAEYYTSEVFYGATKLVGGAGTKYSRFYTGKDYARIDTAETPGYFTAK